MRWVFGEASLSREMHEIPLCERVSMSDGQKSASMNDMNDKLRSVSKVEISSRGSRTVVVSSCSVARLAYKITSGMK